MSTRTEPSAWTNSMRTVVVAVTVTDCSLPKKSPSLMAATRVLDAGVQTPMECGCFLA